MNRLRALVGWLDDPALTSHPRYRAWSRRRLLVAVRAGAVTVAAVQVADSAMLAPAHPELLFINVPIAVASLALYGVMRSRGSARRYPVIGAFLLGLIGLTAALLPIVFIPSLAPMMAAYLPILVVASALFAPWTIRWHVPWLLVTIVIVAGFAASPWTAVLSPEARQELVSITLSAAVVSFAGHVILDRERRRTFRQRMQVGALNQTARHQRRELSALAARMESVARRDPLTGIGNRLKLDEDIADVARSGSGSPLAAVLLDLDHFKQFNDQGGHLAGDAVLREVARTLAIHLRPRDRIYRYGGEEFLVLLDETTEPGAVVAADRLRQRIAELALPHPENRPWGIVTVSAGVAAVPAGNATADGWVGLADQRLYDSKANGRNRVTGPPPPIADRAAAQPAA